MYFNQQTHACACVCIVKNDEKHYKIIKKLFQCNEELIEITYYMEVVGRERHVPPKNHSKLDLLSLCGSRYLTDSKLVTRGLCLN